LDQADPERDRAPPDRRGSSVARRRGLDEKADDTEMAFPARLWVPRPKAMHWPRGRPRRGARCIVHADEQPALRPSSQEHRNVRRIRGAPVVQPVV